MRDVYWQFLKGLSRDEALEVRDAIDSMLSGSDPFEGDDSRSPACPHCGCTFVLRKGRDRAGAQRWLCTQCNRTFGLKACCKAGSAAVEPWGAP